MDNKTNLNAANFNFAGMQFPIFYMMMPDSSQVPAQGIPYFWP